MPTLAAGRGNGGRGGRGSKVNIFQNAMSEKLRII